MTETAIEDLSNRPTHIQIAGSKGLTYSGTVTIDGSSRSVEGSVPDRVEVSADEGVVSGSFWKTRKKGRLQVTFFMKGARLASDQVRSPSDTATVSQDITGMDPLAELQNHRLNALNQAGRTAEAKELYRQQIERNPENATYRYNYGSLLLNDNQYDRAAKHLEKAVELDPDDPKKQYNLGAAYLNKGVVYQDSLVALRDSVLNQNRQPTEEEEKMVKELDQERRKYFMRAIPPLERARRLSQRTDGQYVQDACGALLQAYVQTEQQKKAEQVKDCAGGAMSGGQGQGGGSGGNR